ncbi:1,2-phenylacetyl-CoA epoxidase subunit PaaD [Arthrobacter sp. SLBN-100]|uniref:1,2-phenylacetyl-CoA epoxidase subunit PaaD n=1 Tax=Arthrobacter sp. SLBN-100 TaxID=2768450 RepID=UPI0011540A5B|nr:1,2-phenylacetyl-CoA epoxidase subunit PaaD [Arthrobacter sp. SLBN-100]
MYISDFETSAPAREKTGRQKAWDIAATVCDPEIPVLTIEDLGILRDVQVTQEHGTAGKVIVTITPTYSGCPAMDAIRDDLKTAFAKEGYQDVEVDLVLAPAWTTDWMTEAGKAKLQEYGIAPPSGLSNAARHAGPIRLKMAVKCPQCSSLNTKELTRFGSTSCKALYVCQDCKEPFDYFKVL